MARRGIAVVVALFLALGLPRPGAAVEQFTAQQLADASRVRSEVGFDSDPALIAGLLNKRPPGTRGAGFSDVEIKELKRRDELAVRLGPALTYLNENGSSFGGQYFDHTATDIRLVVNLPPDTSKVRLAEFEALVPGDATIVYRPVSHSQAELEAVRDEVYFGLPFSRAKTAHVDPRQNKVVLTVPQEDLDSASRIIAGRDSVTAEVGGDVVAGACVSRSSCEVPWRGGIYLSGCTWGFTARPTGVSSTRYVLSAGHCSHLGDDRIHDGAVVNTAVGVDRNTYDLGSKVSESMRAPLQVDAGARNLVYISSGNMGYAITDKISTGNQTVGVGIAISGISSLYVEGTIQAINILSSVCRGTTCYTMNLWRATFNSLPGDSGAPIISRTLPKAVGIGYGFASTTDKRALYSPIDGVLSDMQARLCLNATCS